MNPMYLLPNFNNDQFIANLVSSVWPDCFESCQVFKIEVLIFTQFRHFGNSAVSPKSSLHRKSRSKDYDVYSDNDTCGQESEDNFAKELQQYIQAREMANAAQPEESTKKEGVKDTPQGKSQTILSFKVYLEKQSQLSIYGQRIFPCTFSHGKTVVFMDIYTRHELAWPETSSETWPLGALNAQFVGGWRMEAGYQRPCLFLKGEC